MTDPLATAREALRLARAYQPHNKFDAARRDANIAQIERWIAARTNHPAGGGAA